MDRVTHKARWTPSDLSDFARRDWELIAQSKEECWLEQKAAMTPSETIAMAAELNLYVRSIKHDWPNDAERAADLAAHMRLAELFLHAARHGHSSNRDWGANPFQSYTPSDLFSFRWHRQAASYRAIASKSPTTDRC